MAGWNEELRRNITTVEQLSEYIPMTDQEFTKIKAIADKYPLSISRYYLSLIDPKNPQDPIRKMCIPTASEMDLGGSMDTSGELQNTKESGLQHKYSQTALMLSTNVCAMYCRHCFRKRLVGLSGDEIVNQFSSILQYIKEHEEIDNVLISGGDSLLNSNSILERYLKGFSEVGHIDMIRFGSRVPVVFPARIYDDPEFLAMLREYGKKKKLYLVTQFNHPNEITPDAIKAINCLLECGVPVSNQTVLLKGVNDKPATLAELMKGLTKIGVIPYYVFQCRPVTGVKSQFQVTIAEGCEIVEQAKKMLNGHAKRFRYAMSHPTGKIEIIGQLGDGNMLFKYQQAKDPKNAGRLFSKKMEENQCWLEEIDPASAE